MYKLYTKNGLVEAALSREIEVYDGVNDDGNEPKVFFGKLGNSSKFKQRITQQSVDTYVNKLEASGFKYIGVASITKSGRLINVDTFDTLYWELVSTTDMVIARFKNYLKSFVDIYQSQTKQSLSVVDEDMTLLINFDGLTLGIGISQKHNILSCSGKGCGQVSLSQSEQAFWLILYLHANNCIKLSTTDGEIQSRAKYPSLVKDFSLSNKSLHDSLGLGCPFSKIKPLY